MTEAEAAEGEMGEIDRVTVVGEESLLFDDGDGGVVAGLTEVESHEIVSPTGMRVDGRNRAGEMGQ